MYPDHTTFVVCFSTAFVLIMCLIIALSD